MNDLMTMNYRECLVREAKHYAEANDVSIAKVGKVVMNDQAFFKDMADGKRGCTVDTFQFIMRWFADRRHMTKSKQKINDCRL